jgi:hypothetical protein
VLPGTPWRPEGGVRINGDLERSLRRDCTRELAAALVVVADRLDAFADERYGTAAAAVACGWEG